MKSEFKIGDRWIGSKHPVYIIAEMSANHNQDFQEAVRIIHAAKEAGADAIKLQTYTPDTITIDCEKDCFRVGKGSIWEGLNLHKLYAEAYTPWEWQPELKKIACDLNMELFSTPFDGSAVDFLESMDVAVYKIASPEIVDIPLIRRVARTGKPVIMSTGMATREEIAEAVNTICNEGGNRLALLKCTSSYPALPEEMNLRGIPELSRFFDVVAGLSDHTLGIAVPVAAVALGACIIEKHLTLSRSRSGPDSAFSLEPHEFKAMVEAVRMAEKSLGTVQYVGSREADNRIYRRSLFVVKDIKKGESFTKENVRSIRPGHGLHTRYLDKVLGKRTTKAIERGTALSWEMVDLQEKS